MPTRRPAVRAEQEITRLRWSRPRLAGELANQLEIADALLEDISAPDALTQLGQLRTRALNWHDRTKTVLTQAFTDATVAKEYDPPAGFGSIAMSQDYRSKEQILQEQLGDMKATLDRRVRRLRSIRDRLDVFDEDQGPTAAVGPANEPQVGQRVFLVHGHDGGLKHEAARTIQQLTGLDPIILHEQTDSRRTIIEKFEAHAADVGAAVVLLTPDDEGRVRSTTGESELMARARQNVVYELGWFDGRLGRGRVVALYVEGIELPSDLAGILYIAIDKGEAWKLRLGRELRAAGIKADLNNIA